MAIAYQTFGVNEFAARLPSALTGLALTAMVFYTLRYFGSPTGDWGKEEGEKVRKFYSILKQTKNPITSSLKLRLSPHLNGSLGW
jgi:hypothetical protein